MSYLSRLAGGKPIIEYCGGTEIGGGYITSTVVQPNVASAFSTPAIGNAFVILDEKGQPSDAGELFLIPPAMGLSRRLLNGDHDAVYHQGSPVGPKGEPLRRHGDQIQALGGGYFRALGRADDTMNLGGIKVGAAEIERVLTGIPGVAEVAAIAVPPPEGGPGRLVVCVGTMSPTPPDAATLQATMQEAIKSRLNPLFKIHEVYVLERLPRTASNKIIRRQLRQQYEDHRRELSDD
jgi:acetyl-CoA synthetase